MRDGEAGSELSGLAVWGGTLLLQGLQPSTVEVLGLGCQASYSCKQGFRVS